MKTFFEKIVLLAYGRKMYSESTLEIPVRTLVIAALFSVVFGVALYNVMLESMRSRAIRSLKEMNIPAPISADANPKSGEERLQNRLVKVLPPDLKRKVNESVNPSNFVYLMARDSISFSDFLFTLDKVQGDTGTHPGLGRIKAENGTIAEKIVGNIDRFMLIPTFSTATAAEILSSFHVNRPLIEKVNSENLDDVINYAFLASMINHFRKELSSDYGKPRRQMQALGGGIQFVTCICAIYALIMILLRMGWCWVQKSVTGNGFLWKDRKRGTHIWDFLSAGPEEKNSLLASYREEYGAGILPVRLISAAIEQKNEGRIPEDVDQHAQEQVDQLEVNVQKGEYEIINYLLFAIPNLGFLGTIIGIVIAMANVSGIIESSIQLDQIESFDKVGGALGLAFDTTAVSLFLVLILSLLMSLVRKMEADLFVSIKEKIQITLKYYYRNTLTGKSLK